MNMGLTLTRRSDGVPNERFREAADLLVARDVVDAWRSSAFPADIVVRVPVGESTIVLALREGDAAALRDALSEALA